MDVRPFTISIDDAVLDDLDRRLAATRWPEAEPVDDWTQGTPLRVAQELAAYWADGYDWRAREAALNRHDHFLAEIDGLDIHFIHQRSPEDNALPLVMTHGWPGSVIEFEKVIGPLVDPVSHGGDPADAFHLVCPSLPGYGFSGKPTTTGWSVQKIATAWDQLMVGLGYDTFLAQGGDWGAAVTTQIGRNEGACIGIHTNMPIGRPTPGSLENPTEDVQVALAAAAHYQEHDSGYSKQQSTRPQTLGYGLVDSPVGQMSWILEKYWAWTDCDGDPFTALTRDEMLDNIMLYWLNGAGASSARLYWESFSSGFTGDRVELPTGVASFPHEIVKTPRAWAEVGYNVVHWTDMPRGGHFAAWEVPELLVDDIRTYARRFRT